MSWRFDEAFYPGPDEAKAMRSIWLDPRDDSAMSITRGSLTTFTFISRDSADLHDIELNELVEVVDAAGKTIFVGHLNSFEIGLVGIHMEYTLELSNKLVDTRLANPDPKEVIVA